MTNKQPMFKYTKRLIAEISFQLDELKWDKKQEKEINQVGGYSGHDSMGGYKYKGETAYQF